MHQLNCLIIDDEPLARQGLEKYAQEIEFLQVKGICKNAIQANTILQEQSIDLLFLDIEMPMLSGIDFLKTTANAPAVIFTTAYPKYALDGYQFDVIDYLLKPISFERFLQASNKALRLLGANKDGTSTTDAYIFVKTDKQLVKIMIADILYVEGMQNYIIFHTTKEKIMALVPLKNIFELLSAEAFIQIHKSFIVAKDKVESIVGNQVSVNGKLLPISTRMKKEVLGKLTGNRLLKK